jgi:hypothetical protein
MRELTWFALYAGLGVAARALNIWLCRYIQWELAKSADGKLDIEATFSFYPDLPCERCLNCAKDFPGAWTHNSRVSVLMWFLAAIFSPVWAVMLFVHATAVVSWFFNEVPKGAWRDAD